MIIIDMVSCIQAHIPKACDTALHIELPLRLQAYVCVSYAKDRLVGISSTQNMGIMIPAGKTKVYLGSR